MSSDSIRGGLAAEKVALDLYLDSLYEEAQEEEGASASVIALVPEMVRRTAERDPEPRQDEPRPCCGHEDIVSRTEQESGEGELRLLLFRLCGLSMAVPASDIERTLEWPEELSPAPGGERLRLGILENGAESIPVMDLAGLVIPERLRGRQSAGKATHILITACGSLGLACHGVEGVVGVASDAVNWRTERTSRRWLAGTVAELGSALLDIAALQVLLAGGSSASGII